MKCPRCGADLGTAPGHTVPGRTVECTACGCSVQVPDEPLTGADGERVPDIHVHVFRGDVTPDSVRTVYEVDGVRYDSREAMPPEVRRLVENTAIPRRASETLIPILPPDTPLPSPPPTTRAQGTGCGTLAVLVLFAATTFIAAACVTSC